MTSTPHHLASMSSDEPRGYGVRGDVRKRLEAQRLPHPDPAVCELMARAWDEGQAAVTVDYMAGYDAQIAGASCPQPTPNPYRSAP